MSSDVVNYLLYFIWNVLDMAVIIRYMNHLYGKRTKNYIPLYLTTFLIAVFVTVNMHPTKNYVNILAISSSSLLLLAFYPKNLQKKLLFSFILLVFTAFGGVVVYFTKSIISQNFNTNSIFDVCIYHIVFFILLELALKLNKSNNNQVNIKMWILLLSIPLFSTLAFPCMIQIVFNSSLVYKQAAMLGTPLVITLLYINLIVFYIFDRFSVLLKTTTEKMLLKQQIIMQEHHYQEIESVQNRIRKIRHDMKNNLEAALYLLEDNQFNEAKEYLSQIAKGIKNVEKVIYTGNSPIDSILNIKIAKGRDYNISISTDIIIPQKLKMTFEQAVVFIGNIMDNAIEACMLLPEDQRQIKLKMTYEPHMLFVYLSNPISKENTQNAINLDSKKEDALLHGLGMKNIQQVVEAFNGTIKREVKDGNFILKVILYDI